MPTWVTIVAFLNKWFPLLILGLAYMKGKKDKEKEVEQKNLEKKVEYAEIRADKSNSIDDDLDRMQGGTY